jgi:hypothetical protein
MVRVLSPWLSTREALIYSNGETRLVGVCSIESVKNMFDVPIKVFGKARAASCRVMHMEPPADGIREGKDAQTLSWITVIATDGHASISERSLQWVGCSMGFRD